VGAVWSTPAPEGHNSPNAPWRESVLHAGHFLVDPSLPAAAGLASGANPKALASGRLPLPAWLSASPLRFKEGRD
jgi:hypothetical protein